MKENSNIRPIQFLPIILLALSIPAYFITKSAVLVNSGSMLLRYLDELLGTITVTPISGLPIGIIGLKNGWNKALSVIDIVIGSVFALIFIVLIIMFFMMLGAIASTH